MPVRELIAAVYVQHPTSHEELVLLPGACPEPEVAALVVNPCAWAPELDLAPSGEGGVSETGGEPQEAGGGRGRKSPPRRTRQSPES